MTFVIPAYNEAGALPATLGLVDPFLEGSDVGRREVVVVDDGSADGTAAAAEALGRPGVTVLRHERNLGKGAAVRTGVLAATASAPSDFGELSRAVRPGSEPGVPAARADHVIVVTDADGNYLHCEARPFLEAIRTGADIVLAARTLPSSSWRVSRVSSRYIHRRRAMGRAFAELTRRILGADLGDTQTGLKFIRAPVARELFGSLVLRGYAYDVEVLCRARRRGYTIRELPLAYCCPTAESKVGFWEPVRMARDLLRIRRICRGEPRKACGA